MLDRYSLAVKNAFAQLGQTPTEIANILLEVASAEKPQLRYQTSELSHKMVGLKLVDPTGNKTIELSEGRLQ